MQNLNAPVPPNRPNIFASVPHKFINSTAPVQRSNYVSSILCDVKQIDDHTKKRIHRGGIIFYTFYKGELHLCFGRDRKTNDLTDFGGRKESHESIIECAIREGKEESRSLIQGLTESMVQNYKCIYNVTSANSSLLIIFVPIISYDEKVNIFERTCDEFLKKVNLTEQQKVSDAYNEMNEIVWVSETNAKALLSDENPNKTQNKIYCKVRKCIKTVNDFSIDKLKESLKMVNM